MVDRSLIARVFETDEELNEIRDEWRAWNQHPNADPEFFRTIIDVRSEVRPYIIGLYRSDVLETLVIGRIERTKLPLKVGYWTLGHLSVVNLAIIYGGVLGSITPVHCAKLMDQFDACSRNENCHMVLLHFAPADSPIRAAFRSASIFRRDFFEECRPHWIMDLPSKLAEIYDRMSTKARKNRKYEIRRFEKTFDQLEVRCYEAEEALERAITDAEQIARRTYQRGLGVGFESSEENRARFALEMQRGSFRGYFLYVDEKPIAFVLGTVHKSVLHDNFSAFDPEYSRFSPGTYLFFKIFELASKDRIKFIDFGFGDAWYKANFGTEKKEEVSICLFSASLRGISVNFIRTLVQMADRLGKAAVDRLGFLRSIKKVLRERAEERTAK